MLDAESVTVRVGTATLLRDADLACPTGRVTVIVGPNGAGKSTLLATLSGELRPTAGTVRFAGVPIERWPPRALARRRAVLPQSSNLQFHFTVEEVVALGCDVHGPSDLRDARGAVIADALERANVLHLRERLVPTLSGGERQRVHFARCLAQLDADRGSSSDKVLLLDEPTANLDPAHQHQLMIRARHLADDGLTVVAVVHDLNLAASYADGIVVLDRGRIDFAGDVREGLSARRLARVFGINVRILAHPVADRPLIVPLGPLEPGSLA